MAMAVRVVAVAVLPATQLPTELAGSKIDAGVQVLTAFLCPDHGSISEHRHLRRLLRYPWIPGHRQVNVRLSHHVAEMMNGPLQLCLGIGPQGRRDLEVATMDQQLHALFLAGC